MIVITVGKSYVDIDGYASSIAYRELLKLKNIDSVFVSNAFLNYSITDSLKNSFYSTDNYTISDDDKFIILDLSDKSYFPKFVNENNIVELIDHHPGFEDYWINKLGNKAIIEPIGSVATIIFEKYENDGLLSKMSREVAILLMAAILDNTLNFTANITSNRDKEAYDKLEKLTKEYNYASVYFSECQKYIEDNLLEAIKNDIKTQNVSDILPDVFAQLTIWNAKDLLLKKDYITRIMNGYGNKWMINIISLNDNTSYVLCSNNDVSNTLEQLFNCSNEEDTLLIKPAMLRKEIIAKALKINKNI